MRNLARHSEALVEDMTPIKRTLPSPSPGPSHQSIPAILVSRLERTWSCLYIWFECRHCRLALTYKIA